MPTLTQEYIKHTISQLEADQPIDEELDNTIQSCWHDAGGKGRMSKEDTILLLQYVYVMVKFRFLKPKGLEATESSADSLALYKGVLSNTFGMLNSFDKDTDK